MGRRPLRECEATDEYICSGMEDGESWEPRFTFHGFRYFQVDGWPEDHDLLSNIEAVVCHTDMEVSGHFSCSEPALNQLYENTRWSMRGNFLSIPTDCPQRDERLGWTGDIAQFAPTATKLYNCLGMLRDWLSDVAYEQRLRAGIPTLVTPNILDDHGVWGMPLPIAIWHDVVILVPWALYEDTGDENILRHQYESMVSWTDSIPRDIERQSVLWDPSTFQLGDWLDPTAPPDAPMKGQTDPILVANAFLVRSLDLMSRISGILGQREQEKRYLNELLTARKAFADEYITRNGLLVSDSQTAYALAICFDLFPTLSQRLTAGARLATIVLRNGFKIGTGFAGTPFILEALLDTGHDQVAYSMLLCRDNPSWLYPISMGATTIWERWDSMLEDGTIYPGEMTSFNHYCLGSVTAFLFERLAGLQRVEPGWRKTRIAPSPGGGIRSASAEHLTPYGPISCSWEIKDDEIIIHVVVPAQTTMEIVFPSDAGSVKHDVGPGQWTFSESYSKSYVWPVKTIPAFPVR